MKCLPFVAGAVAVGALIACGASANAPDDGTKTGSDDGDASIYDGGTDYAADSGGGGEGGGETCDTTTVLNCGSCGNVCAGLDAAADNVRCTEEAGAAQCFFSCQGEHYDIDQDASDGCEKIDSLDGGASLENHNVATAVNLGSVSCHDDSSAQNLSGVIPSDDRVHEDPGVIGFDSATGSAPDYWTIVGSGGTCDNDLNLTLTLTGAAMSSCYTLTATTSGSHGPYSCTPSGTSNTCGISNGSGSYDNGATIVWWVSRTCTAATPEAPTYTITGHL